MVSTGTKEHAHAHNESRRALAHPLRGPGQRRPGRRDARRGHASVATPVGKGQAAHAGWSRAACWRILRSTPSSTGSSGGPWASASPGMASTARATRGPTHRGRFVFSRLPFLSARRPSVARGGRACGTRGDVRGRHRRDRDPEPCYPGLLPPTRRAGGRGFFVGANLWSVPLLLSEALRPGGDLRRAWLGNSVGPPRHASSDSTF